MSARSQEYEDLNLTAIWRTLARRRILIAAIFLTVTIGSIAASYLIEPIYRADVVLANQGGQNGAGGLGELFGQYRGLASLVGVDVAGESGSSSLNETIEVLRSRSFTQEFVNRQELMPILFHEHWNAASTSWKHGTRFGNKDAPSMWDAYERFDAIRKISKDAKTGFVKLSIEWRDPAIAAAWANSLVALLNKHLRQRAVEEANRSIAYLQEQIDKTPVVERRQMLIGLMETETRKIMLAKAKEEYAVRVLDRAVVPEEKVKPRRAVIAMGAALAGLMLGVLAAFSAETLAGRKRT